MKLAILLLIALALVLPAQGSAQTATCGDIPVTALTSDRQELWKAVRWTIHDDASDSIDISVQYQKQMHLLCFGDTENTCFGSLGTDWAWDNRGKLNEWHTTLHYTGVPLAEEDDMGIRAFSSGAVSGRIDPDGSDGVGTLKALTITGKLNYTLPSSVSLPGGCTQ